MLNKIKKNINSLFDSMLNYLYKSLDKKMNEKWFNYPFGREPQASKEIYLNLAKQVRTKIYPEIDQYEKKVGYAIDMDWMHELALHTQVVKKESPLCYAHGRILYSSLSYYLNNNIQKSNNHRISILETGTARGFSSLCMAKALKDSNKSGAIITFDVLPHRTRMYWNCIDDHDGPKSRAELLEPWKDLVQRYIIFHQGNTRLEMPKVQAERIHFAFLDGTHTYEDVLFEFHQIQMRQQPGDMIVYDDYTPKKFPGIVRAVDQICEEYQYHRTELKAHGGRGYIVAEKE